MTAVTRPRALRWGQHRAISPRVDDVLRDLVGLQNEVVNHEVYGRLDDIGSVRLFMQHHVFAVFDFMWLLKGLQRELTCVEVPWVPTGRRSTRFINEIVVEEESDVVGAGWSSHFELYLSGMRETGADLGPIEDFVARLGAGEEPLAAMAAAEVPPAARRFMAQTWDVVQRGQAHELAGAFAFGRENVIPTMFAGLTALRDRLHGQVDLLVDYLGRHIELDGEIHTPLAFEMVSELCGDDDTRWNEARDAARKSLRSRVSLWDAVVEAVGAQVVTAHA